MPKKVFYWEAAVSQNVDAFRDCQKQITALLNGDYQTADLDTKKLRGYKLYTARINDADRLLFTTLNVNGRAHLLLLEVIKNHDYQKSKYLNKPSRLKKFYHSDSVDGTPVMQYVTEAFFDEAKEPSLDSQGENNTVSSLDLDYSPALYYQERFIVLNEEQASVQHAALPLIVSGPPGSGKSCVALTLLKQQLIRQQQEDSEQPLLYVSKSSLLVRHMQTLWQELVELNDNQEQLTPPVSFMSYEELIARTNIQEESKIVTTEHFENWYAAQSNQVRTQLQSFPVDVLYQELHIAASVEEEKDYLMIGRKNSLLGDAKEDVKQQLYTLCQNYKRSLSNNQLINLDFFEPENFLAHQAIVVDESQDFTPLQLRNLYRMATNGQIAYCLDTHQSLVASKSILPYLEKLTRQNHIKLPLAYRSGKNIIAMANTLIAIKNNLVGGMAVKDEVREIVVADDDSRPTGTVHWYQSESDSFAKLEEMKAEYKETEIAVIAWSNYIDEARKFFNTPLLFTPDQIKGLEYKVVIAYRPLDQKIFENANIKLRHMDVKEVKSRAKGETDDQFGPPFNQLFTVATRAIESVVFLQNKTYRNEILIQSLANFIIKEEILTQPSLKTTAKITSQEEWCEQAKILLQAGKEEQAREIFISRLGKTIQEFDLFKSDFLRVFDPKEIKQSDDAAEQPEVKQTTLLDLTNTSQPKLSKSAQRRAAAELKEKNKKLDNYVKEFLANVSPQNIENLFKKPKILNDILFMRNKDSVSIFQYLIIEHADKLITFWQSHPQYIRSLDGRLTAQALSQAIYRWSSLLDPMPYKNMTSPLLTKLIVSESPLLYLLINNNSVLVKQLPMHDYEWFNLYPEMLDGVISPFSKLLELDQGIDIFSILLDAHPSFALRINGSHLGWTHRLKDSLVKYSDETPKNFPLECFARSMKGVKLLKRLFELNIQIPFEISVQSLVHKCKRENENKFNQLRKTEPGRAVLKILFTANPRLITDFAFYPREFLLLLQDHPECISLIDIKWLVEDFFRRSTKEGKSFLSVFLGYEEGLEAFKLILNESVQFATTFKATDWVDLKREPESYISTRDCTLLVLLKSKLGPSLFLKLLNVNPLLSKEFKSAELNIPIKNYQFESCFSWMMVHSECHEILYEILIINPQFAAEISVYKILTQLDKLISKEYVKGRLIFNLLLNADNLYLKADIKNSDSKFFENIQPLLEDAEGLIIFDRLKKLHPRLGLPIQIIDYQNAQTHLASNSINDKSQDEQNPSQAVIQILPESSALPVKSVADSRQNLSMSVPISPKFLATNTITHKIFTPNKISTKPLSLKNNVFLANYVAAESALTETIKKIHNPEVAESAKKIQIEVTNVFNSNKHLSDYELNELTTVLIVTKKAVRNNRTQKDINDFHRTTNSVSGKPRWRALSIGMIALGALLIPFGIIMAVATLLPTAGLGSLVGEAIAVAGVGLIGSGYGLFAKGRRQGISKIMHDARKDIRLEPVASRLVT